MASRYRSRVLAQLLDGKRSWSNAEVEDSFDRFKTEIVAPLRELRREGIIEDLDEISAAVDGSVHTVEVEIIGAINYQARENIEAEIIVQKPTRVVKTLSVTAIAVIVIGVGVRFLLNTCLDIPLSKLIPDSLTTALVLIALAVVAAPYLAGQDIGPLKVPKFAKESGRKLRIVGPVLMIILLVVLFIPLRFVLRQECNQIKNGSAEDGDIAWIAARWTNGVNGKMEIATDQAHLGAKSFKISTSGPHHLRWIQPLRLEPHANYLLTAWVRTQDVAHSQAGEVFDRGANAAIQFMSPGQFPEHSEPVIGTNEWRQLSLKFATKELIDIEVQLQLGGYGSITTGTVWFDDVRLRRLAW